MEKIWAKLSLLLNVVAMVMLVVGIATPEWLSMNGHYEGLWIYCYYMIHTDSLRKCINLDKLAGFRDNGSWIKAVRGLMIICIVLSVCNVVTHIVYIIIRRRQSGVRILRVMIALAVASVILCAAGLIIYTTQVWVGHLQKDFTISWSFITCAVGGGVTLLTLIPVLCEIRMCRILAAYEAIT